MAKANNQPGDERSRGRIVVLDFDLAQGEISQLAGAIVSALKPPLQVVQALPPAAPKSLSHQSNGEQRELFDHQDQAKVDDALQEAEVVPALKPQNASRNKGKLRTPVILPDLEFTSGDKSLEAYVTEQAPSEHSKRYLVITQWLKLYRGVNEVGADHIYTCYRYLGLSVPDDVLSTFRALKKQGWVEAAERGTFRINHIGEKQLINAAKNKE